MQQPVVQFIKIHSKSRSKQEDKNNVLSAKNIYFQDWAVAPEYIRAWGKYRVSS